MISIFQHAFFVFYVSLLYFIFEAYRTRINLKFVMAQRFGGLNHVIIIILHQGSKSLSRYLAYP